MRYPVNEAIVLGLWFSRQIDVSEISFSLLTWRKRESFVVTINFGLYFPVKFAQLINFVLIELSLIVITTTFISATTSKLFEAFQSAYWFVSKIVPKQIKKHRDNLGRIWSHYTGMWRRCCYPSSRHIMEENWIYVFPRKQNIADWNPYITPGRKY